MLLYALIMGGVDTGWYFYTPYSTLYSNSYVFVAAMAVFINGFSTILTALNFVVTIHRLRAPGMTWMRLPLVRLVDLRRQRRHADRDPGPGDGPFCWRIEFMLDVGLFDPARGGDPLLWQHMFWFYSHPAVYIMILPAMGVVSELIPCYARRPIFGYAGMVYALMSIAILSFFVWGHHMFTAGISIYSAVIFSLMTFLVAVPSAIKVFNWTVSLHKGQIQFRRADALCARLRPAVYDGRRDRAHHRDAGASTCTCRTRISSSRISITSWSAARSALSSAGCISGGRRSPAGSTRRCGRALPRS